METTMSPNPFLAFAAAALAALALGACGKVGTKSEPSRVSMAASPAAQLIGTTPAPPSTEEPPGVTPVAKVDDQTRASEDKAKQAGGAQPPSGPKEGDDSSHFTNAPGKVPASGAGSKEAS
jgi:hypothetical protein